MAGLILAATTALHFFFPKEKLKRLVIEHAEAQLHRQVRLGDVSLGLTGLTLKNFTLSEVRTFAEGAFLSVDELTVRWRLWPLVSKHVRVNSLTLKKPEVHLVRMHDGNTYNVSDLAGGAATSGKTPSQTASSGRSGGWSWRVDEIHLIEGMIRFDDRSAPGQTAILSPIDLVIRDFDPSRVHGRLTIGQLKNPAYTAQDLSAEWSLQDIDPTLRQMNGWIRLKQGTGQVQNLTALANSVPAAKVVLLPLVLLQAADQLGFISLGLPDVSHLKIDSIDGDYKIAQGTLTIQTFQMSSPQLAMGALGTAQLSEPGTLAVDVSLKTPQPDPLDLKVHISGTLSHPKTDLRSLKKKAFKATLKKVLDNPGVQKGINDTLKNIFH